MSKIKIQGHASGTGVLTVTAPNTSTDRTITLPDATGTLLNSDGSGANLTGLPNGSQLDHSGTKKIEAVSAGAAVTGNLTTTGNISTGNNGMVFILDSAGQTSGRIVTDSSAANALEIGADPNNQASGSYTAFRVDNTERMRITPDGLTFNGDTAAANALDDYEEGTWTPTISGTNSCSMGTIHNSYYTKIGRNVTLSSTFIVTSSATPATGSVIFGGFPFAFKTQGEGMFLIGVHYNYKQTPMAFMATNGHTYYQNTTVGGNNLGNLTEGLDASNQFAFNFTYLTDA